MQDYSGKYFSILGDSISTLKGYSYPLDAVFYDELNMLKSGVTSVQKTWWWQVIDNLGGNLLVNNSFSGSKVTKHPLCEIPSYGCSDERTSSLSKNGISPNVIMLYLGTNDWGAGRKLTSFDETDLLIFSNAYKEMLRKLKTNYPNAEIWCFTLAVSKCTRKENFSFRYCYGGENIVKYCEVIKKCAHIYNCKVVDLFNCAPPYDTIDEFHPNADGMKTLGDAVTQIVKNFQ